MNRTEALGSVALAIAVQDYFQTVCVQRPHRPWQANVPNPSPSAGPTLRTATARFCFTRIGVRAIAGYLKEADQGKRAAKG